MNLRRKVEQTHQLSDQNRFKAGQRSRPLDGYLYIESKVRHIKHSATARSIVVMSASTSKHTKVLFVFNFLN